MSPTSGVVAQASAWSQVVSLIGILIILTLAWLLSTNRRVVNWRVIAWGLGLQLAFALFVFVVPAGTRFFLAINDIVVGILDSASAGTRFLFGRLALPPGATNEQGESSVGFILAFQALPTIVFFASLAAGLYYVGVLPALIRAFAYVFTRLMRVSGAESLCASANIFVGIESALTVRPHLAEMTRSELCTVLTVGMATIASNVMALYVFVLRETFPTIAGHLVSASILSAPAALAVSKLILPETDRPLTLGLHVAPHYEKEASLIESLIQGANAGLRFIAGIVALLLAFLGLVALVDLVLGSVGGLVNQLLGLQISWTLRDLLGLLFYPLALVTGIPPEDASVAGRIIGERLVATEVQSYRDLALALEAGTIHYARSAVIIAYALCGFAHVASLAIFVGGVAAVAPSRTRDLAVLGPRALVAATLACLLTACVAGIFFRPGTLLLGQ